MTSKICPRCKQKDNTDFSTCRFCGFQYGAALPKGNDGMGFKIGFWPLIIFLFGALWIFQTQIINAVGYVATGGKEKNVVQDSLIDFAASTTGQDPQKFKAAMLDIQTVIHSEGPIDEAIVRRMAAADNINVDDERRSLLKVRADYRHKHHLD